MADLIERLRNEATWHHGSPAKEDTAALLEEAAAALEAAREDAERWLVFNVGCIECGVSSNIVGVYATQEEATRVAEICSAKLSWRGGGQNSFEVFDLRIPQADEYRQAIDQARGKGGTGNED